MEPSSLVPTNQINVHIIYRSPLNGINTRSGRVKMPSLVDIRVQYKSTLRKHPLPTLLSTVKALSGQRSTRPVLSTRAPKRGRQISSMLTTVRRTHPWAMVLTQTPSFVVVLGKHSVVIPSSLPAGQYLLRKQRLSLSH